MYSGNQEFLGIEAGFNPEVQSQHEISFPPAATQLILMNVCFMDYAYRFSCYLSRLSDSLLSGLKLSYLWVATQVKPKKCLASALEILDSHCILITL